MPHRRAAIIAGALLAAGLIGGCNPLSGFVPTQAELLAAGVLPPADFPPGPPAYCYRTLAEVDCYRAPQAGEAGRLVGSDPPFE